MLREAVWRTLHELGHDLDWEVLGCIAAAMMPSVNAIATHLQMSPSDVSKSLGRLRQHGLVSFVRNRKRRVYSVTRHAVRLVKRGERMVVRLRTTDGKITVMLRTKLGRQVDRAATAAIACARSGGPAGLPAATGMRPRL